MRLPARVEPVNEIMSTSGCFTSASPAAAPVPVTTLSTPLGRPAASATSARMKALNGATSEGLSTTRAAGGERRRHLERDLVQRVVPRRDRADHADRLAHHQGISDSASSNEKSLTSFA